MKKSNKITKSAKVDRSIDTRIENLESLYPEDRDRVQKAFASLGVNVDLCYISKGPTVVRMALCLPKGMSYSCITKLVGKLQCELCVPSLRIEVPIPGSELVGIEFPRSDPEEVNFSDLHRDGWYVRRPEVNRKVIRLPIVLGKDIDANVVTCDLASAPHILVSGAPGQGSTQFIHSVICGLVASRTAEEVQFILIDPRCAELSSYSQLSNLVVPIINDMRRAVFALHWAVAEMESRLRMFAKVWVRDIEEFNLRDHNAPRNDMCGDGHSATDLPATIPHIVIVISDFDDVMEKVGREVLPDIQRLTLKARAVGIHLVLETQRPDKKVLPGALMANIPVRVAFRSASVKDSRMVLDDAGAESLLGHGDALVRGRDGIVRRMQTPSISDEDIEAIVAKSAKSSAKPHNISLVNEVEITIRLPVDELKVLQLTAQERRCNVDDIVSEFVHEQLNIVKESFAEDPFK